MAFELVPVLRPRTRSLVRLPGQPTRLARPFSFENLGCMLAAQACAVSAERCRLLRIHA